MIDVDDNQTVSIARQVLIEVKESIIKLNDAKRQHDWNNDLADDREYIHNRLTEVGEILKEMELYLEHELAIARHRQATEHKFYARLKLNQYKDNNK